MISFSFSEDPPGCSVKDGLGELYMTVTEIKNGMALGPAPRRAQGEVLVKPDFPAKKREGTSEGRINTWPRKEGSPKG